MSKITIAIVGSRKWCDRAERNGLKHIYVDRRNDE